MMQNTRTIIAIDYINYTENAVVTAENLEEVRAHIADKKWSYVIEGSIIIEKADQKIVNKYLSLLKSQTNAEAKAERFGSGYDYDPERFETWNNRIEDLIQKQHNMEAEMSRADKERIFDLTEIEF